MILKEYFEKRECRPEFKREFARYQPEIECVRILVDAQIEQNLSLKELAKKQELDNISFVKFSMGNESLP